MRTQQGAAHIICAFSADWPGPLPLQVRVEEELAFIDGSSIYKRIVATGAAFSSSGSGEAAMDTGEGSLAMDALICQVVPGMGTP